MSEQLKTHRAMLLIDNPKLLSVLPESGLLLANDPVDVVFADEAIAALAAKDARIAELEAILGDAESMMMLVIKPPSNAFTYTIEQIGKALYGREVAATPSEDGREVPEVIGHLLLGGYADQDELEDNDIELDMKIVERLQVELVTKGAGVILALMTIAQHSRIVAAKDAEIARLNEEISNGRCRHCDGTGDIHNQIGEWICECPHCLNAELNRMTRQRDRARAALVVRVEAHEKTIAERDKLRAQLDTQPARQVGDSNRLSQLEAAVREFAGFFSSDDPRHWELHGLADNCTYGNAKEGEGHE